MSSTLDRLVRRLVDEGHAEPGEFPAGLQLHRTHAGHHQRSAGAWSWWAAEQEGGALREVLASQWPLGVLVRAERLSVWRPERGFRVPEVILPD